MNPPWDDEAFTFFICGGGLSHLWSVLPFDVHPPLFYLLQVLFPHQQEAAEFWLRAPAALWGTLAIPAVILATARMLNPKTALLAGVLVALSPMCIVWSQTARSYSLLAFLLLVTAYFFAAALASPGPWRILAAGVAGSAVVATHYLAAAVVIASQGLYGLLRREDRRSAWLITLLPVVALLVLLPLLALQIESHGLQTTNKPNFSLPKEIVRSLLIIGISPFADTWLRLLGLIAFGAALLLATRHLATHEGATSNRFCLILLLQVLMLYSGMWTAHILDVWNYDQRFVVLAVIPIMIVLSKFAVDSPPVSGYVLAALLLGVEILGTGNILVAETYRTPDFRSAAAVVNANLHPADDGVIVARGWGDLSCYLFYDRHGPDVAVWNRATSPEALTARVALHPQADLMSSKRRLWVVGKDVPWSRFEKIEAALREAGFRPALQEEFRAVRLYRYDRV